MKPTQWFINGGRPMNYPNARPQTKQQGLVLVLVLVVIFLLFLLLAFTWDRFFASSKDTIAANQSIMHYQQIRGEIVSQLHYLQRNKRDTASSDVLKAIKGKGAAVPLSFQSQPQFRNGTFTVVLQRLNSLDKAQGFEHGKRPVIYGACDGDLTSNNDDCHNFRIKAQATFDTLVGATFMTQMVGFQVRK